MKALTATTVPTIVRGGQFVDASVIGTLCGHKVRISIRSDSYDFQCYARIHVWRPAMLDWSHVHAIPYQQMRTKPGLCYLPNGAGMAPGNFAADIAELMRVAKEVLG